MTSRPETGTDGAWARIVRYEGETVTQRRGGQFAYEVRE